MKGTKTETRISKPTPCQSSPFGSDMEICPQSIYRIVLVLVIDP